MPSFRACIIWKHGKSEELDARCVRSFSTIDNQFKNAWWKKMFVDSLPISWGLSLPTQHAANCWRSLPDRNRKLFHYCVWFKEYFTKKFKKYKHRYAYPKSSNNWTCTKIRYPDNMKSLLKSVVYLKCSRDSREWHCLPEFPMYIVQEIWNQCFLILA